MPKILSKYNPDDTSSSTNRKHFEALFEHHHSLAKNIISHGHRLPHSCDPERTLSARDRIKHLLDSDSGFLEVGLFAGYEENDPIPCAGAVAGIGKVSGRLCMILANDATVKGGTYYPITVKKHLRAQEIAEKNHLPCIYLVDSGGAFLPLQSEVFPDKDDFGRIFYNQARMSAKGITQVASVHGLCTAGGAYIPSMSDQSVIVEGRGCVFLAGPPLVKAATGEEVTAEDLGGAWVHAQKSGVVDHLAKSDHHALEIVRDIISRLKPPTPQRLEIIDPQPPAYPAEDLLAILQADPKKPLDIKEVIARLVDGSVFFEFKKHYGASLVTGFAHIEGMPVGIIANNGVLFCESALKGTHFIELCVQEKIPLLFLQNITGFMVGKAYEAQGIAKDGAKLVHAVSTADIPKITLVVGGSFGAGNYGMCGRAFDPNFLFMWPHAKIAVMGGEQAANVLMQVKEAQRLKQGLPPLTDKEQDEIRNPVLKEFNEKSSALYSSSQLWDDGIIDPRDTRKILSLAFAAAINRKFPDSKPGVYRM